MEIWIPKVCATLRGLILVVFMVLVVVESKCDIEAIFNFGDSNSDTGEMSYGFPKLDMPYGMTYFKQASGRASDGRLSIDFLTEALGKPMLSPYLQSVGSDFRHGANFAARGGTTMSTNTTFFMGGPSPFFLWAQAFQMRQFKADVEQFYTEGSTTIPPPDVFGKSLYTINIGQNDINGILDKIPQGQGNDVIETVLKSIGGGVEIIYGLGGRTFWVYNVGPMGCFPNMVNGANASELDPYGCRFSINSAVETYNNLLKKKVYELREIFPNSNIIYVDVYSAYLGLYQHPLEHGLQHGVVACCGNKEVGCGMSGAPVCQDPENYVSWDGLHATEAANKAVAKAIVEGSLFEPPFPLSQLCDIIPIE